MADDTKIFRLTWVFEGKQFTGDLNQAALNAVLQTGKVIDADVQLTNIKYTNARKRIAVTKEETDAVTAATRAQLSIINQSVTAFGPATERTITSISRVGQSLSQIGRAIDPAGTAARKAQTDIEKLSQIIERSGEDSKEGAEAINLLVAALAKLNQSQQGLDALLSRYDKLASSTNRTTAELTKLQSARTAAMAADQQYLALQEKITTILNQRGMGSQQIQSQIGVQEQQNVAATTRAFEEQLSSMEALAAEAQRLKDTLNPIGAIERNLEEELKNVDNVFQKTNLSLKDYIATYARLTSAAKAKISEQSGAKDAIADYDRLTASAQRLLRETNPLIDAQTRYRERIAQVNELVSVYALTQQQAANILGDFVTKEQAVTAALAQATSQNMSQQQILKTFPTLLRNATKDFVDFGSTSNKAFGLSRVGLLELQAAGVNTFQSLAAGISPLRTLTTEGAQVAGGLIQLGLGFRTLLAIVTPLATLAAAVALLGVRFLTTTNNARLFKVQLDTIATGTDVTTQGLQDIIDNLTLIGVKSDDTKKALSSLLQLAPQGLNVSTENIRTITTLGANIAAAFQRNPADEIIAISKALTEGAAAVRDYARAQGVFQDATGKTNEALVEQIDDLVHHNDTNKVAIILLGALAAKFDDTAKRAQAFGANAIDTLTAKVARAADATNRFIGRFLDIKFPTLDRINAFFDKLANIKLPWLDSLNSFLEKWADRLPSFLTSGVTNAPAPAPYGTMPETVTPNIYGGTTGAPKVTPDIYGGTQLGQGGAITFNAKVVLDTPDLQRIGTVLGEAIKDFPGFSAQVISTERPGATVAGTGGISQHGLGRAADVALQYPGGERVPGFMGRDTTGLYTQFGERAVAINQQMFPGTNLIPGTSFRAQDSGHFQTAPGGTVGTSPLVSQNQAFVGGLGLTPDQKTKIDDIRRAAEDTTKGLIPLGVAAQAVQAKIQAYNQAIKDNIPETQALIIADEAYNNTLKNIGIQAGHTLELQDMATQGTIRSTDAYDKNEEVGLRSLAVEKALVDQITQGIPARQAANQELQKGAAEAVLSSRQQLTSQEAVLDRTDKLARASLIGAAAEHQQSIENQAHAQTYDALQKAQAAYNQAQLNGTDADKARSLAVLDLAQKEDRLALAQAERADRLSQVTELGHALQINRDQSEVLTLQIGLQGQTTEEITKQVALLQLRQQIGEKFNKLGEEEKNNWIESVTAVQNLNVVLAESQRAVERINQFFVSIGENISNTLGQAISDAFDGKKITDWKERISSAISSIMNNIAQFTFIRPLIGTALGAVGLGQAAQTFGSFGSLFGGGMGQTATGNVTPGTGTQSALGIAGQAGGLLNNIFGGGGGGLFSGTGGISSFVNNIGGSLGFATPLGPVAGGLSEGSLFGFNTLGSVLGSGAIGLGAGGLVSSLLGGNKLVGSVGGGLGGIAGGILGPLLGATGPIGGIIGGLLGGLTSIFGNNRPSNNAAGANVNFRGTGANLSGQVSSPDQASNQTVQQITQAVQQFAIQTAKLSGGTLGGDVSIQAGVRDGIKVGFAGILGGGSQNFSDAQSAINDIELKIAHSLTGVSDSLKNVLANITDPTQVQSAVTFALAYDNLKKAVDSAFSSISTDTKQIGPFEQALDAINSTFADLTATAQQFGVSLDPINAALAEATRRLQQDFGRSLDQALNTAAAKDYVNQLLAVSEAFKSNVREQQAIGLGGDTGTTQKINRLEALNAQSILTTLSSTQLTDLIAQLGDSAPEISALAQSIIDSGQAAVDATQSFTSLADGIKSLAELGKSLKTGALAGLTGADAATAAYRQFQQSDMAAQQAGYSVSGTQLATLSQDAQAAVEAFQAAYGNAPQTAALRKQVINDLDYVLTVANQAQAAIANVATALTIPSSVQSAQDTMRTQALSGVSTQAQAVSAPAAAATTTPEPAMTQAAASTAPTPVDNQTFSSTEQMKAAQLPYGFTFHFAGDNTTYMSDGNGGFIAIAARGMTSTPPGPILVGEVGPEWMGMPSFAQGTMNWKQVGRFGPEVVNQSGGATILPFPIKPHMMPAFAEGTDFSSMPSLTNTIHSDIRPNITNSNMSNDVVAEIRALRTDNRMMSTELTAIKKQIQGGQIQASNDAKVGNTKLTSIETKITGQLVAPQRRVVR